MEDKVEFAVRLQLVPVKQVDAHEPATTVLKANAAGELLDFKGFKFIRKRPAQQDEALASANKRAAASQETIHPQAAQADNSPAVHVWNKMDLEHQDGASHDTNAQEQYPEEEDIQLHEQLLECLPASCPLVTRLSLLVTHLLQQPVNKTLTSAHDAAYEDEVLSNACDLLGQRFCQLLTHQVTLARNLLIEQATAVQPTAADSNQASSTQQPSGTTTKQYDMLAPAIRAAAEGPELQAALNNRLTALHAEEALWRELAQQYSDNQDSASVTVAGSNAVIADGVVEQIPSSTDVDEVGSPVQGLLQAANVQPSGCDTERCPATPTTTTAADDVLGQAVESAHDEMIVKVDAVSGQVATVQVLLRRAQQAAASLQAQHFMDKFAGLAHVNTPQALIRNISSMPAAAAAGIMAAATPVVTPQGTPLHA